MSKTMEVYYFSPTGGTKKVTQIFVDAMEGEAKWYSLGKKEPLPEEAAAELTVFAAPVFGGRIPSVAREKIKKLIGAGKKAVTLAVYGNRAYEDALLEMNDLLTENGFTVIALGAFVAQHSMDPEVGAGRPDQEDAKEIRDFANAVRNKKETAGVQVPGNHPYKAEMKVPCTPISRSACNRCGACVKACPTEAISMTAKGIATDKKVHPMHGLHQCLPAACKNSAASGTGNDEADGCSKFQTVPWASWQRRHGLQLRRDGERRF